MRILFFLATLSFLLSCNNNSSSETAQNKPQKELKDIMPGIWESVSLKVTVNSAGGKADSTYIFEVPEEEWEQRLGINPIRTYYELDNKYRSEYRAYGNDSLMNLTRGIWNTFGDTLMLIEPDVTYIYDVEIKENGTGIFRSFLDWDGDELPDDEYIGVQRYVSKSTKDE